VRRRETSDSQRRCCSKFGALVRRGGKQRWSAGVATIEAQHRYKLMIVCMHLLGVQGQEQKDDAGFLIYNSSLEDELRLLMTEYVVATRSCN
jgi:hypothetical protein